MINELSLILPAEIAYVKSNLKKEIAKELSIQENDIAYINIIKRSVDARKKDIKIVLKVQVVVDEPNFKAYTPKFEYLDVTNKEHVIIVGAGPAGLYAALRLIEKGIKPIIIERGKQVSERKIDVADIYKNNIINPESNYCFGEGGAGVFSDGKLFTRSTKRGDVNRILELLYYHGAKQEVLFDAHPHIGTDKLPTIIKNIRKTILDAGGEFLFNSKLTDLIIENNKIKGIEINNSDKILGKAVILATGHSADDIYELLYSKNIAIEAKPFAMGIRVEHSQELIDNVQYHGNRGKYLPAASYSLSTQIDGRGVYSFCMCPGGFIVPSATSNNQLVVNGMSSSERNSKFANSGIAVEIRLEDIPDINKYGALAGLKFQQQLEQTAYINSGKGQVAPVQFLPDFLKNKISAKIPETSYIPGVMSSPIHHWMPEIISDRLKKAFKIFNNKIMGFINPDAVIFAVESRTSSTIRIPRNKETLQHINIKGLYPCGEGAGYSGGIVSSAIDGVRCAEAI